MDKMKEAEEAISKFTEKMENLQEKLFKLLKDNGVTEEMLAAAENNPEANPFSEVRDRLSKLAGRLPDPPEDSKVNPSAGGDEEE